MTDPIDADSVIPQAHEGSNDCFEEPPVDPNAFSFTGTWELHNYMWLAAGILAVIACLMSFVLIYLHLRNYTKPNIQKQFIRILIMVPVYAIDSFLSFRFYRWSVYFDLFRDSYEAFVIYSFVMMCIHLMGGEPETIEFLKQRPKPMILPLPFCCIKIPQEKARKFLRRVIQGCLQYVVLRPLTTLIAVCLHIAGVYCPGSISPLHGYIYINAVVILSVLVAMYALVALYENAKHPMDKHKPLLKFLAIKFVIFFSFWQSIFVAGLVKINVIQATTYWTADNVSTGINNFLITAEMVIASILHIFCFSHKEFIDYDSPKTNIFRAMLNVVNLVDVAEHTRVHAIPRNFKLDIQFPYDKRDSEGNLVVAFPFTDLEQKAGVSLPDEDLTFEPPKVEYPKKAPKPKKKFFGLITVKETTHLPTHEQQQQAGTTTTTTTEQVTIVTETTTTNNNQNNETKITEKKSETQQANETSDKADGNEQKPNQENNEEKKD